LDQAAAHLSLCAGIDGRTLFLRHWEYSGSASVGGASDGNIAASTGAKVLDGLGAEGVGAHAPNESIKISTIEPKIKLTTAFINELLK